MVPDGRRLWMAMPRALVAREADGRVARSSPGPVVSSAPRLVTSQAPRSHASAKQGYLSKPWSSSSRQSLYEMPASFRAYAPVKVRLTVAA
jgi:hypothetical protein